MAPKSGPRDFGGYREHVGERGAEPAIGRDRQLGHEKAVSSGRNFSHISGDKCEWFKISLVEFQPNSFGKLEFQKFVRNSK